MPTNSNDGVKRRAKISTGGEAVRIMQGAKRELAPPSHVPLDDMDWPYWHSVVGEYANADWTDHALEIAALLARTMANLESEQRALRAEGFITTKETGTRVENPRARAVKSLTNDILQLRRSLSLNARAKSHGDNRVADKRRSAALKIQAAAADDTDDLLASPGSQ